MQNFRKIDLIVFHIVSGGRGGWKFTGGPTCSVKPLPKSVTAESELI